VTKRISSGSGKEDVDAYIASCPASVRGKLAEVRSAIMHAAPGALETTSYFQMPGYFYPGYDYNGMFAWFGYQKSYIRLLLRPPTIEEHSKELSGYKTTKSALHLPLEGKLPAPLIRRLVATSVRIMKERRSTAGSPTRPRKHSGTRRSPVPRVPKVKTLPR
jgi:uncharacterized protein YdhG (YjbR/CyaY superfamily)